MLQDEIWLGDVGGTLKPVFPLPPLAEVVCPWATLGRSAGFCAELDWPEDSAFARPFRRVAINGVPCLCMGFRMQDEIAPCSVWTFFKGKLVALFSILSIFFKKSCRIYTLHIFAYLSLLICILCTSKVRPALLPFTRFKNSRQINSIKHL